ncbi:MAG: hypothetical protein ABI885_13735 [Gammaproteobacteria bacterium]
MNPKDAAARRAAPQRTAPTLNRTPAGRRSFVLRLVRDRAAREAHEQVQGQAKS